jgi:hypothetical protein
MDVWPFATLTLQATVSFGQTVPSVVVCRSDVEAEHHPALVMLGDVAVRHPEARVADVQEDVHPLPGTYEHSVLPLR